MPLHNFKTPMTAAQLRDIGVRRDPADIILLLWEIEFIDMKPPDDKIKSIFHNRNSDLPRASASDDQVSARVPAK